MNGFLIHSVIIYYNKLTKNHHSLVSMKLCNMKISLYFEKDFFQKKTCNEKIISTQNGWTFTLYLHSPRLVNVTGLKSSHEIKEIIALFEEQQGNKCTNYKIDSCMISHKDRKNIKLEMVPEILHLVTQKFRVDYNPEIFTGLYLKPYDRDYPTINIFYTSSFQLLGGKSLEKIEESISIVKRILSL